MESDTAQIKIQSLCDTLKQEALEPAQHQATQLINQARAEAETLVQTARQEAEQIRQTAKQQMQQERAQFDSSLRQATAHSLRALRCEIEEKLFRDQLVQSLSEGLNDPVILTRLIHVIIDAIARDGLGVDLSVEVSKAVDISALNSLLGQKILKQLRDGTCLKSTVGGGARIRVHEKALTFELSDQFLRELLESYIHSEFVKLVFQTP